MRPPSLARLLVKVLVADPNREFLLGDLDEQFARAASRRGQLAAWRRYWRQALGVIWHARSLGPRRGSVAPDRPSRRLDMWNVWRDIRLGARTALRSPGYSAIAILTLALAIGANTLLFSIANPLLLRPLPIKDSHRLGWIWEQNGLARVDRGKTSVPDLLEWRRAKSFTALAGWDARNGTLIGREGTTESVLMFRATPSLQDVWGLRPVVGRLFEPEENAPGRPLVGVLAYHYWHGEAFHADPAVIGRSYFLNGTPITIVGVMEPEIELGSLALCDIWVPLPLDPASPRDDRTIRVIGRLAPGATVESADAELRALSAIQAHDHPTTNLNWEARVVSTTQAIVGPDTWVIIGLLGVVVVFVLLIACANLANLALARLMARDRELAVRQALGASRLQLIRPLLTESTLLSATGGLIGFGLAHAGLRAINATAYDKFLQRITIDGNVLVFTAALTILTPLLFSLWPALVAGRAATVDVLRAGRSSSGGPRSKRGGKTLVGVQVALALSLLVVAGLVLQTVENIRRTDIGLDVPQLITANIDLPRGHYPDDTARAAFADQASDRLRVLPGATDAAVASHLPVFDPEIIRTMTGTKHDGVLDNAKPWLSWFAVSPRFFSTVGIRLLAGRGFTVSDRAGAQPVAILNRTAAEKYFDSVGEAPGRAAVVHDLNTADRALTIVGVVTDTRDSTVMRSSPQLYVPIDQWPVPAMRLVVRSDAPDARAADMRAAMRALDQTVGISNPKTMRQEVLEGIADNRIIDALFGGFAVLALVLAAAGLYGVVSYSVRQRHREIGVRLALGADPRAVRRMILREGLTVTAWGVAAGLVVAFLLAHASASVLYGISPNDAKTFAGVVGLIVLVACVAIWAPAIRAMRVDPAQSLRAE